MSDRFIKNAFSVFAQTVTLGIVWIILYRYIIDSIGIEKLGVWSIILATISTSRLSEIGFTASVTKLVANYRSENDEVAAAHTLQTGAISLGVIVFAILSLIYPIFQYMMPVFLPKNSINDGLEILPYALISVWFSVISGIWMSGLDGCLRSDIRSGLMVLSNLVLLTIAILLVKSYGLVGLAIAQIFQGITLFLLGWVAIKKIMPSLPLFPREWTYIRFRSMVGYGVNFQYNSIVMMLFDPITKILLGRFGDLAAVGFFEMTNRIVMLVRSIIISSNQIIVPIYAGIKSNDSPQADNIYIKNTQYMLFLSTPLFIALMASMPIISEVWLGNLEDQFIAMGMTLTLAWYFNSINAPAYFAYLGRGRLIWVTVGMTVMGVMNILLGVFLGILYGWYGVILANVISLSIGSIIITVMYHRENSLHVFNIIPTRQLKILTGYFMLNINIILLYWGLIKFNIYEIHYAIALLVITILISFIFIFINPLSGEIYLKIKNSF
jgi:O-antigen/teichoic acid export membrane protein